MIEFIWNDAKFEIVTIGNGVLAETIEPHYHSKNSFELHFITGGAGGLDLGDKKYQLSKGNFFITGPGVIHSQTTDINNPVSDIYMYIQVKNEKKCTAIAKIFLNTHFCFFENFESNTASEILKEYNSKEPDSKTIVSGLFMALLSKITRCYLPNDFRENIDSRNLNDRRFLIIEEEFLNNKSITLKELAEKIGVCERQTERLLKQYYGKTFREKKSEQKKAFQKCEQVRKKWT